MYFSDPDSADPIPVTYDICEDERLAKVHKVMRGLGDLLRCPRYADGISD